MPLMRGKETKMTTMLQRLRQEQAKHAPGSELQKLLCWAELHIGDQFDRICELEDELKAMAPDIEQRVRALNEVRGLMMAMSDYILKENFSLPMETFARDFAPWRNVMAANGMNQDGSPVKSQKRKRHNAELTG